VCARTAPSPTHRRAIVEPLVDADGMTVYLHMLDEQDEATCVADCAVVWIPVEADDDDPTIGDVPDDEELEELDMSDVEG
jgi:predicted lipoprotein with Yx(FWY)xxD motif